MAPINDKDPENGLSPSSAETVTTRRGRRSKKDTGAAAALEKIKQFRETGEKVKYKVDQIENIYDEVDEDEYSKVVRKRQLQDDWIVDDDGTGYVDDGREIFDEELEEDPQAGSKKSQKKNKKKINVKKPAAQTKTIQSMFLSGSNTKKKENENVTTDGDELLDGILQDLCAPKPDIKTPSRTPSKFGGRTPKSAGRRNPLPRRLQPPPAPSYRSNDAYKKPVSQFPKSSYEPPPLVSETTREAGAKTSFTNVFKKQPREETDSCQDNITNIKTEVVDHTDVVDHLGDVAGDFDVDDFGTDQDIEMLNAVEEKALKTEEKPKIEHLEKNRGATNLTKTRVKFDELNAGETFETIRGHLEETVDTQVKNINVDSSSLTFTTHENGEKSFKFYWIDAFEDSYSQPGTVYMFGKVWIEKAKGYVSCCVIVKNVERTLFFLPRAKKLAANGTETDEVVGFSALYEEFNDEIAERYNIMKFSARRIMKGYAFEIPGVPEESEYLEVKYSANCPELPSTLTGKTFSHVFGTKTSSLEQLLLQRKIKGPGWLEIKIPQIPNQSVSWCKLEAIVNKPDHIIPITDGTLAPPPLVVLSLSVQTMLNPKTRQHEVLVVTGLVHHSFHMDKVAPKDKCFQKHFCAVTKPQDFMFPYDFKTFLKKQDMNVEISATERSLLGYVVASLQKIDPDVVVGHDISTFDIDVLLHRINICKVPQWSRIGRLRRQIMPKLSFGGKSGFAERMATCGRLICDVKISAQELIRCKSYDLTELSKVVLKSTRTQIDQDDVPNMYSTSNALLSLLNMTLTDCLYTLKIMYELNVIPLALQITNIAGNLMSRTLLGGRSERNEYLLLHAFHERNFICPDKSFEKKRKDASSTNNNNSQLDTTNATQDTKRRKKPAYSGGLVLEPKKGFYDTFILLLDFNSLYPSIIQEYNICFTTVDRTPPEGEDAEEVESWVELPDSDMDPGVLPVEIKKLVERRKEVKKLMKGLNTESDQYLQYDIRQKALKLTANSMYGCLGFSHSRFYAKPLAALVTSKGREILMKTKDLVQQMNLDVIYGDTDSIMINTNTTDFKEVFKIGNKVKNEVNKLYKLLEIDIDGVYKSMLLLKKKKYAAISIQTLPNGTYHESKEMKGLDIVRRDWCELAKDTGNFALDQILSSESREVIVENIAEFLTKVGEDVTAGNVALEKFIINKQLTKAPNEYPDKKSLPHVHVALWLKSKNRKVNVGDTIPYVICEDGSSLPMAQRAYHPDEFIKSETLKLDCKYYLAHQVHPVVSRLCDPIDGTDAAHIANCLGLDPSGYRSSISHNDENDALLGNVQMNDGERFKDCERFSMTCRHCNEEYVYDLSSKDKKNDYSHCSKCNEAFKKEVVLNKLTLQIRKHVKKYYMGWMICDDPSCGHLTREVPSLHHRGPPPCPCQRGNLHPEYTDTSLYTQLLYYQRIFTITGTQPMIVHKQGYCLNYGRWLKEAHLDWLIEGKIMTRDKGEDKSAVVAWFSEISAHLTKILEMNAYSEVDLPKLFRSLLSKR